MHTGQTETTANRSAELKEWLAKLEDTAEERGYFQPLGDHHFAVFTDESPTLLVTFETVENIRRNSETDMPLGYDLVSENGWSQLTIIAEGNTWFRDPHVYGYFDRLVDDGFFEDFDQVVFIGAGMCGYAAAAFSVTSPGATVIAIQPQATLDPRVTEWDDRFPSMRRVSFTDRYGYAPDMIDAADRVFVLYDPEEDMDAIHAALFTRPHVTKLRCRYLGRHLEQYLQNTRILQNIVDKSGNGQLCAGDFYKLFRARRNYPPYLHRLIRELGDDDRNILCGMLCRNIVSRMPAPRIRNRLATIEKDLASQGLGLPTQKARQPA
jgi:hypothetical protein